MNKKWFQLWNIGRLRGRLLDVLSLGRTMLLLAGGSLVFFMLLGAGGLAGQKLNSSPIPSMKGLASSLSSGFFMDLLGMEVPHLPQGEEPSSFSGEKVTSFVFQLLTSVNPSDPKSLLSREVPGMAADDPFLLREGSGGTTGAPVDFHPGTNEQAQGEDVDHSPPDDIDDPVDTTQPEVTVTPAPETGGTEGGTDKENTQEGAGNAQDTSIKRILIYHSHPREAYNPLLGVANDNPSSGVSTKNVMLVGSYISKRLEQRGIGTIHSKEDFPTKIADYNWNFSYKYSRLLVKSALAANQEMNQLIDIHRDSQRHGKTTANINGESYAQVYFIIGHANKDWRKNEEYANQIHQLLEKNYPGISRGIWGKAANKGNNGEYNQTLSPNSVLIEVGGIDNTAEELKRTSDILADAIADVYWSTHDAEKVNVPGKEVDSTTQEKSGQTIDTTVQSKTNG